jgi:hypothetical protein
LAIVVSGIFSVEFFGVALASDDFALSSLDILAFKGTGGFNRWI